MALSVLFISGPRGAGKSTVIRAMLDRCWKVDPHFIRMIQRGGDKIPPKNPPVPGARSRIASALFLEYEPERIFEILPEALTTIHRRDRYGAVIIEADADPILRCAYPYDHRLFIMPVPTSVGEVFRPPHEAADEFRRVLDDTASFAEEIFGLLQCDASLDSDHAEERVDLTQTQMRGFLYSPLGDELATRIQLQPPYHGLVESDVVLMNARACPADEASRECLKRIERLLERLHGCAERTAQLFLCNPLNKKDHTAKQFYQALAPMCVPGK